MKQKSEESHSKGLFFLIVSSLLTIVLRINWLNAVGYDEGIYTLVARLMTHGITIYRDIPLNKPPLIFILNSPLVSLGGNLFAARVLIICVSIASSFIIYKIIMTYTRNYKAAFLGGAVFSIFTSIPLAEIFFVLTEPYVILFELIALYFLIKAKTTHSIRNFVAVGVFAAAAIFTRQTSVMFSVLCLCVLLIWRIRHIFSEKNIFLATFVGFAIFTSLIMGFLISQGTLELFVFQTTTWAIHDVVPITSNSALRQQWFMNFLVSSSPLWFLSIFSMFSPQVQLKQIFRNKLVFFLFSWVIIVIVFYIVFFGPGYHHEYAETLAPLSILAGIGFWSIILRLKPLLLRTKRIFTKVNGIRIAAIVILISLFGSLCFLSFQQNIKNGEVFTNDYGTITKISDYIELTTKTSDRLLVFETQIQKIGPLIYLESNRQPIWLQRGFNALGVTNGEANEIIQLLRENANTKVVIIGGRPSAARVGANELYNYVISNYVVEKDFGYYSPYPGKVDNLIATAFQDLRLATFSVVQSLNLSKIAGASHKIENNSFSLSDKYLPGYTIFYPFAEKTDLSSTILSITLKGGNESLLVDLDLVDTKGSYMRHEINCSSSWQEIIVPINSFSFKSPAGNQVNLQNIKQINFLLKANKTIDLGINQISLLKIDE